MNTIPLTFDIMSTDPNAGLGVRVRLNNSVLYENSHLTSAHHFSHDVSDEDAEHELEIEMFGKLPEHTKISDTGEIISDVLLEINNIAMDGLEINKVAQDLIEYHHDFNGGQTAVVDKFYGSMGCNGCLRLKFTTPIYLWLLENM